MSDVQIPGHSSVQMAGLVSARFRAGMRPLAIGTALCVALSAPLADFLLERRDLFHRGTQQADELLTRVLGRSDVEVRHAVETIERTLEDVASIDVFDGARLVHHAEIAQGWPTVHASSSRGRFTVVFTMSQHESLQRDSLLLSVFGALGTMLGLALYFFPLRLFREEDLVLLFARRSIRAAEDERLRLSRDLHDGLGQTLGTAAVALAKLKAQGSDTAETARLIDRALDELRHISLGLRPPTLDDLGLGAAVGALAQEAASTGLRADVQIGELPPLHPELEQTCFRLAQEALSNIVRHAQARGFHLVLARRDENIVLEVSDDGRGFSPASGMGLGLVGARERAAMFAGSFTVESTPGRGARLRAVLPIQEEP